MQACTMSIPSDTDTLGSWEQFGIECLRFPVQSLQFQRRPYTGTLRTPTASFQLPLSMMIVLAKSCMYKDWHLMVVP